MMVTAYSIFFSIARYNRIAIISQLKKSCYNLLGISIFLSLSDVISFFIIFIISRFPNNLNNHGFSHYIRKCFNG
jgi:hypothetical protein